MTYTREDAIRWFEHLNTVHLSLPVGLRYCYPYKVVALPSGRIAIERSAHIAGASHIRALCFHKAPTYADKMESLRSRFDDTYYIYACVYNPDRVAFKVFSVLWILHRSFTLSNWTLHAPHPIEGHMINQLAKLS